MFYKWGSEKINNLSKSIGTSRGGAQDLNQAFVASYQMRNQNWITGPWKNEGHLDSCTRFIGEEAELQISWLLPFLYRVILCGSLTTESS